MGWEGKEGHKNRIQAKRVESWQKKWKQHEKKPTCVLRGLATRPLAGTLPEHRTFPSIPHHTFFLSLTKVALVHSTKSDRKRVNTGRTFANSFLAKMDGWVDSTWP